MTRAIVVALMVMMAGSAAAEVYRWPVRGVYDGDTIYVRLDPMPIEFRRNAVRVAGVDAPEIKGKCKSEREAAIKARDFVRAEINTAKVIEFSAIKREKYGRVLARVTIDGRDLAGLLISHGLARPYDGKGARRGWCEGPT